MSLSLCLFGLLLGMRHALEPDHLAAVSTLVVTQGRARSGALLGSLWGLGHTLALLTVATLLAVVGATMPPRLATLFELGVALMLVGIGLASMSRGMARVPAGEAGHRRGQPVRPESADGSGHRARSFARRSARRSLLIGTVHGLAGSGALTALVASHLPSTPGRLFYVALFGLGSVVGMTVLSGAAGWPLARLGGKPTVARILTAGSGLVAFALGIVWGLPLIPQLLL